MLSQTLHLLQLRQRDNILTRKFSGGRDMTSNEANDFAQKYPKIAAGLVAPERFPENAYRDYQRILEKIEALWGNFRGQDYLEELLTTQRTDRQGFPDVVASELIRLHLQHVELYPGHKINPHDPFSNIL